MQRSVLKLLFSLPLLVSLSRCFRTSGSYSLSHAFRRSLWTSRGCRTETRSVTVRYQGSGGSSTSEPSGDRKLHDSDETGLRADTDPARRRCEELSIDEHSPRNASSFIKSMETVLADDQPNMIEKLENLLERVKAAPDFESGEAPIAFGYNTLILGLSKSHGRDAGARCRELLRELWSQYNVTGDARFLPLKSSYVSTLTAIARSGTGRRAAERAEELLDEMERLRYEHSFLGPTTLCVNIVL